MKIFLLILASVLHLAPHPFGVSTIGAISIYAGANSKWQIAWLVPLVPLLFWNLLFGFYDLTVLAFVYAGFALSAMVGHFVLRQKRNGSRYGLAVMSGAFMFYLVSNYAVWLVGMYPPTMAGLATCYLNGIPYLATAMLADGFYCLLLFGLHGLIDRQQLSPAAA